MGGSSRWAAELQRGWRLHGDEPAVQLLRRGWGYVGALLCARWYLRQITSRGARLRALGRPRVINAGHLQIDDDVLLRSLPVPVELVVEPGAVLHIGAGSRLNFGVSIGATRSVQIGRRVRLGPYVLISDSDYHDLYRRARRPPSRPVFIDDDVWIAARATVLPGVRIGRGAVVAAAALVRRDVPPFTVVAGVPARPIRELDAARLVVDG